VSDWVRANLKNGKLNAIYKKYHGNDLPDVVLKGT
jgi:polar amino acid transport system substrate-binding protein